MNDGAIYAVVSSIVFVLIFGLGMGAVMTAGTPSQCHQQAHKMGFDISRGLLRDCQVNVSGQWVYLRDISRRQAQ